MHVVTLMLMHKALLIRTLSRYTYFPEQMLLVTRRSLFLYHNYESVLCKSVQYANSEWQGFHFWLDTRRNVHTHVFVWKQTLFFLQFGLLPTCIWWKRSPKTYLFKNALQGWNLWRHQLFVYVWMGENGDFLTMMSYIINTS